VRRVIVESPFAGETPEEAERNLRYLRACMRDCLLRGESPYASHGLYTQPGVLNDAVPEERDHGIQAGFAWRAVADATIVYSDLGVSRGMVKGIQHADKLRAEGDDHEIEFRELGGEWEVG